MSAVNHTTVALVLSEAMQTMWTDGVKFDMFLIVTDAASYTKKPAEGLSVICMKHDTDTYNVCSACFVWGQ
jgi:hypothetical protein